MRKLLIISIALLSVFLAIGCTGNQGGNQTGGPGTPVQAVTAVTVVTAGEVVTPVQAVVAQTVVVEQTPVTAVTPAVGVTGAMNQTEQNITSNMSEGQNATGGTQQGTHVSRYSQERMTEIARMTAGQSSAGNNTSSGGAVGSNTSSGY